MTLDINAKHEELYPQPQVTVIHTEEEPEDDDSVPEGADTEVNDPDEDEDGS
jgi:hypothetical protein